MKKCLDTLSTMMVSLVVFISVSVFLWGYYMGMKSPVSLDTAKSEQIIVEIQHQIELLLTAQNIVMCESSARHDGVWGDKHKSYPAYGIGQFQERTFYWLADKAEMTGLKWNKVDDQLRLLLWAIDNGHANLWTCYRRIQ